MRLTGPAIAHRRPVALLVAALVAVLALLALTGAAEAQAAVTCPNANPVVNENNCMGAGSQGWRLDNESDDIGGYSTKTSFNLGEAVPLKIARNAPIMPATRVDISVYRTGYYGGLGGRLIPAAGKTNVTVNNSFACNPLDPNTGKLDCGNWNVTHTIPAAALPATGVYVAELRATDTGIENRIVFVVRDDNRATESKIIDVLPTASWQAYNNWGGKSLYYDKLGGPDVAATGTKRAAKLSFNRPLDNASGDRDRYFGPDFHLVQWMEQQGYDVSYTDDVQVHLDPAELRQHKSVVISGHSEYWSQEEFNAVKAARDAGVHLASFSANTAYWKVRYENGTRTLVCFKTVQGDGTGGSGRISDNDWGPDGIEGNADDALGADGKALTADDHPENSTTTFRDNGAPDGDLNAPVGGRVGPDMPENLLFGVMYFGDNDHLNHPLTVPATNANGEYSGDRVWRRAGLPTNSATNIGTGIVGWEWDAVPTQAQYLSRQPSGVKRLSNTDVTASNPSWLQDEGRARATTPPAGQPGTVNAVKYTAPSGALVFASGTMQWAWGLAYESDVRIEQATYNIFADMGIQPLTPDGVTLDPAGTNQSPSASFSVSATPVPLNQSVEFNGSASSDPDGTIASYQWDLDGNGSYETSSGTNPRVNKTYTTEGTLDVRLKVTDNGGGTDFTVRTIEVIGNRAPTAALTATPNPAVVGQSVALNGAGSSDPDGTITNYKWDLDGNGSFETDTGSTATRTTSFAATGTVTVGLRVTDNGGKTATATVPVTVNSGGVSNYGDAVLDTAGLKSYWRMGETGGPTFADSKGTSPATATSGVTFGVPGGPQLDPNTAARFNGSTGAASANLNLSTTSKLTVEFWLKVNSYTDDDALALEHTANFNGADGGFIVDPNAPQGGRFAVALGRGSSRNNIFFTRPTAAQWHHYAFVMDTTAPAATQITPYVDGQPVTYTKMESGTGAGPFANAALWFMSRGGASLFSGGDLDEVAVYDRTLSATEIASHHASYGTNRRPVARFTASPNPVGTGQTVTFNGSTSSDPDGTIQKYEWDLDGNGSYETDSGSNPQTTRSYSAEGDFDVRLRVSDNLFGTDTETKALKVGNQAPIPSFTAAPNPAIAGQTVSFNAGASTDADGTITKYEWDLDGNGSYETDTGTTKTTQRLYDTVGGYPVGLRLTDNGGKTATTTVPVTVNSGGVSNYGDTVLGTAGLSNYWRMGEASGTTLADSKGTSLGTLTGGPVLGVPGAMSGDPNTSVRFDGVNDHGKANVDLSSTNKLTVEFWLKWNNYTGDDELALEHTPNFNGTGGGFIVDPDAPQFGGRFGIGLGRLESRNNVFIARPSTNVWHHYAFVMDTSAPAATQITPYVDGKPVTYQKLDSGTGAGNFASSVLNFMSRNGTGLFGQGDLDEVALYKRALTAGEVAEHHASYGNNRRPTAAFTVSPAAPKPGQIVTFNGSGSTDPDGTITKYEWDLDGNGSYETDSGTNPQTTKTYASEQSITVKLRVTDDLSGTDTEEKAVEIGNKAPTPSFTVAPSPANVGETVSLNAGASADADGTIAKYEWDLDGNGSFETDRGTNTTATSSYASAGTVVIGLRVTDDGGKTATTTRSLSVRSGGGYRDTILGTTGLVNYWRMGEATGASLADSKGASPAALTAGTLGAAGAIAGDTDTAVGFNGTSSFARANLNLSNTSKVTVEFWMKWNGWADDDDLAMEFTDNFNQNAGGFLVDPNASNGDFGVALGVDGSRNSAYFNRPSAGQWHHYAFVFDTTAPAAQQVIPYVDGVAVPYTKGASGTGGGPFANSALSFMSRAGAALFGAGQLDEVAVYNTSLSAATVAAHHEAGTP